jgi:hypothetical protein
VRLIRHRVARRTFTGITDEVLDWQAKRFAASAVDDTGGR